MKSFNKIRGYTLVEIVITITILGLLLIPLGIMITEFTQAIVYSRDLGVAEALARTEMAKVNNIAYGSLVTSNQTNYEGYAYDLYRTVSAGPVANLLQVDIKVYPAGSVTQLLAHIVTYVANATFGAGSGSGVGTGQQASLLVTGGRIANRNLQDITLQNTSASSITITGVYITFTSSPVATLRAITMNSVQRWSGVVGTGSTINFTTPFTLAASTTYTKTAVFQFSNRNVSAVTELSFIMSDNSQTPYYTW